MKSLRDTIISTEHESHGWFFYHQGIPYSAINRDLYAKLALEIRLKELETPNKDQIARINK